MWSAEWDPSVPADEQLAGWCERALSPGLVRVAFAGGGAGAVSWRAVERWTRTRAVTVAEVRADLAPPALDVALCSDLVYLRTGVELRPGDGEPSAALVWALGRAGRAALAWGLLDGAPLAAGRAAELGLAHGVLEPGAPVPVPDAGSLTALTTVRDLMRATGGRGPALQLELAAFRLLFASGEPGEGASAFLDRRAPRFG